MPVMARNSKCAATSLRPWPKLSWTVMIRRGRGVDRLVERDGDVRGALVVGVAATSRSRCGCRARLRGGSREPGVGGDACDVEQAIEIDLVAGDGVGAGGEGGEDERAFGAVGLASRLAAASSAEGP